MSDNPQKLDPVDLSALLSSRVCHDLINPVGAISSGLSMIDDEDSDEEMREMADDLVRDGTKKALALLSYARLAYGAAGGLGAEIKIEDAFEVLELLYATTKATLDWQLEPAMVPKNKAKILLILAHAAAESVPRGGNVTVSPQGDGYRLEVTGQRLFLNDDIVKALSGDLDELKPKSTPAYIASQLAKEANGQIKAENDGEKITLELIYP